MRNPDQDILLFFSGHEEALGLYEIFEDFLYSAFPDANRRVQKAQITFSTGTCLPVYPLRASGKRQIFLRYGLC